jgi:hypothetical protein
MDVFGRFTGQFVSDIVAWFDWAVGNWSLTMVILAILIYWAGRQRRLDRHHL